MKDVLRRSAFPHDLDPYVASGVADASDGGKVSVAVRSDEGYGSYGRVNPNAFTVSYAGPGSVASLVFDGTHANPTGGSVLGSYPGLVFNPNPGTDPNTGLIGLPFTLGDCVGITAGDVTVSYDDQAPVPSSTGEDYKMGLAFASGVFTSGKKLRFDVDREQQHSAYSADPSAPDNGGITIYGNSADLLGAGVLIPSGTVAAGGMAFSGTMSDGTTFSSVLANRIGAGYTPLDGHGFINAERAVALPLPYWRVEAR